MASIVITIRVLVPVDTGEIEWLSGAPLYEEVPGTRRLALSVADIADIRAPNLEEEFWGGPGAIVELVDGTTYRSVDTVDDLRPKWLAERS